MSNIQAQIDALAVSIQILDNTLSNVTGNTLSNYNQLSRIVSQQGNIYNTIYYGTGNITTGNLSVSANTLINGNLNISGNINGSSNLGIITTTGSGNISLQAQNVLISNNLILPASLIQTYTPTVTPGTNLTINGSISSSRYFTLGSLKVAFGIVPMKWTNSSTVSGATLVTLPSSFFNNVYTFNATVSNVGATVQQRVIGAGFSTSGFFFYSETGTGSSTNTFDVSFLIIGN
jgi:hypothetical protein